MDYKEWLKKNKKYVFSILIVISLILIVVWYFFRQQLSTNDTQDIRLLENRKEQEQSTETLEESSKLFYVDVKGAVNKPGIYQIKESMRVWDVVQLAGGVKESAETKTVNFAAKVSDQMVIYIPIKGEESIDSTQETAKDSKQLSDKINLNLASEAELQTLTGIGQKKAQEIVKYREENGGFKEIEEIKKISGIGEKTFEKLKESICVK